MWFAWRPKQQLNFDRTAIWVYDNFHQIFAQKLKSFKLHLRNAWVQCKIFPFKLNLSSQTFVCVGGALLCKCKFQQNEATRFKSTFELNYAQAHTYYTNFELCSPTFHTKCVSYTAWTLNTNGKVCKPIKFLFESFKTSSFYVRQQCVLIQSQLDAIVVELFFIFL